MLSHTSRLFQSDLNKKKNITIVLDPDVFFIADGKYLIHPILEKWIDDILASSVEPRIYLLARHSGICKMQIGRPDLSFLIPFDEKFFSKLSEDALAYVDKIWAMKIQAVGMCEDFDTGFELCSDYYDISREEVVVVTCDDETANFFEKKNIAVVCMDVSCQLIGSINKPENDDELHIHCDFDGTLFNACGYSMVKNQLDDISVEDAIDCSIQESTISLLKENSQHPTFLLTQRPYGLYIEEQKKLIYNNAMSVVERINEIHDLKIEVNESCFLDAHKQVAECGKYRCKMRRLLDRYSDPCRRGSLPKSILLIDDGAINEIVVGSGLISSFEELGIKVNFILALLPTAYMHIANEKFKTNCPELFAEVYLRYLDQMKKLDDALKFVLRLEKKVVEVVENDFENEVDEHSCRLM